MQGLEEPLPGLPAVWDARERGQRDADTPDAKSFVEAFTKKFGNAPKSIYPVLAGDGLRVLVEAFKQTGTTESAKVSAYLKSALKNYSGLTGPLAFSESGDRAGNVYRLYRVDARGLFVPEN